MAEFGYFGITQIKVAFTQIKFWESYCHSIRNICLSSFYIETNKTRIFCVVLYGYKMWSDTLREEHKQDIREHAVRNMDMMFENKVQRLIIIGAQEGGIKNTVEKLYSEVHHSLYSSPSVLNVIKSRRVIWVGPVTHTWVRREMYTGF